MPAPLPLEPPLRVSPVIRFSRWAALIVGIYYGASRFRTLQKRENEEREYIAKNKPMWMEEKRKILTGRLRDELLYLAKETGSKIPDNFDEQYPAYQKSSK